MRKSWMLALLVAAALPAYSAEVGLVKVSHGSVTIQRGSERIAAAVGTPVQASDVIVTGADGAAGITFSDNSLVSVGPASVFAIDKYAFDTTTYAGEFQGTLSKGRLAAVSGKMVQQTPESMKIRTPSAIMGVRGTEFVVQVDEPVAQHP
jgi:hypothetical protein